MKTLLVTGGAGFIGSNFILAERMRGDARIINLDLQMKGDVRAEIALR